MPCNMGMDASSIASDNARDAQRKAEAAIAEANTVTAILCKVLRGLPAEMLEKMDPEVHRWFDKHLEHDVREGR